MSGFLAVYVRVHECKRYNYPSKAPHVYRLSEIGLDWERLSLLIMKVRTIKAVADIIPHLLPIGSKEKT